MSLSDLIRICERNTVDIVTSYNDSSLITIQNREIIKLFVDQIETSKNIMILLESKRNYKINSLIRSLVEQFIYLNVIITNPELARRYALFKSVDYGNEIYNQGKYRVGQTIVEDYSFKYDGVEYGMSASVLQQLKTAYNALFPENIKNHIWYNLDGKTTTIAKLVKKLQLNSELSAEYAMLSRDIHSNSGGLLADRIIKEKRYLRFEFSQEHERSQERCVQLLIDSYKLVSAFFKTPTIEFQYTQPDPALEDMFTRALLNSQKDDVEKS